ncbi:MAG: hybrid sensor histidine kinase/response regulator [Gemmatimonadota bacterium]
MTAPASANILVVDDTIENLRLLAAMLGERGYEARPVRSGAEALEAARRAPPDLVLLDITMPEMDGYETCARLKATPGLEDIPVIFLTALGDLADKVKAFAAGGADYVTKPFQIEEVMARVQVHLALRKARVELAQNYERLRALEELRDDLIHMVVHDMRSPLTVLLAHLEFLKDGVGKVLEGESLDDLESAAKAAGAVNRMANDLLDVSRMEEGKFPLVRSEADVAKLAAEVGAALSVWQRQRAIDVEAVGPVTVQCDAAVIRRVIENLVSNAIKHTPEQGRIRVVVTGGAPVRVEVRDEGPGVPVEARETIFEKFGTVAARQTRSYHSAGLGLAFCKLAVEAHGGRIGVDVGDGVGSTFWFDLPSEEPPQT